MTKKLILIVLFVSFIFSACNNVSKSNVSEKTETGSIVGKAYYGNATDSSGIIVTLEKSDGLRSLYVVDSYELSKDCLTARNAGLFDTTKNDGTYSFSNVETGVYIINAFSNDDKEEAVSTNIVVLKDQTVNAEDLVLRGTGSLSGKITLENSETESYGFSVSLAGTSFQAVTDIDGSFIINGIPAGDGYRIVVKKDLLTYMFNETVSITARQTTLLETRNFEAADLTGGFVYSDGTSINWLGSFTSDTEIENPEYLDAYFNMKDGCSYIFNGKNWTLLAKAGEKGEVDVSVEIQNGKDGISINWLGSYASWKEIEKPNYFDAFYNTQDGCSYIFDGEKWTLLAKAGKQGEQGEQGETGTVDLKELAKTGIAINWLGSFLSSAEITEPEYLDAFYNTQDGCSYIYDGENWVLLARSGEQGETGKNELTVHNLKYVLNEGELDADAPLIYIEGIPCTLGTAVRAPYRLLGWRLQENSNETPVTKINGSFTQKTINLYPVWILDTVDINYHVNNITKTETYFDGREYFEDSYEISCSMPENISITHIYGEPDELPEPISPLEFEGWYLNDEFSGEKITEITDSLIDGGQINLYPKFGEGKTYTINYVLNGGTNAENNPTSFVYGTVPVIEEPECEGSYFLGWYYDDKFTEIMGSKVYDTVYKMYIDETIYPYRSSCYGKGDLVKTFGVNMKNINPNNAIKDSSTGYVYAHEPMDHGVTLYAKWSDGKYINFEDLNLFWILHESEIDNSGTFEIFIKKPSSYSGKTNEFTLSLSQLESILIELLPDHGEMDLEGGYYWVFAENNCFKKFTINFSDCNNLSNVKIVRPTIIEVKVVVPGKCNVINYDQYDTGPLLDSDGYVIPTHD